MYCGMYPYSQLSLQSADFSISLYELLLNPSTPSVHLCLQQQQYDTSVQNSISTTCVELTCSC